MRSAISATLAMKPNASTKSPNLYSRWSLPLSSVHPVISPSRRVTSPASSLVLAIRGVYRETSAGGSRSPARGEPTAPTRELALPPPSLDAASHAGQHRPPVNLLLVDPAELASDGTCTLRDRRALHLRTVIGAGVGERVRAGVVGGGIGSAELLSDDGAAITLRLAITEPAPPPHPIELVLAVPRPKVLTRVVEAAAAFGVARIDLTNAWRVDKSYLRSPRLEPDALALAARIGAEQGGTT